MENRKIKFTLENKFRRFIRFLPEGTDLYIKRSVMHGWLTPGEVVRKKHWRHGCVTVMLDGRERMLPWEVVGCEAWEVAQKLLDIKNDYDDGLPF